VSIEVKGESGKGRGKRSPGAKGWGIWDKERQGIVLEIAGERVFQVDV
jgi:hypothetical protein